MSAEEKPQAKVLIFETADALYEVADAYVRQLAAAAVAARGRFLLVLSGGSTPRPLFQRLARADHEKPLPWAQTHIFWGDERLVPPTHPESNFGQAQSLLLSHVPVPPAQVHRIPGEKDPSTASAEYAETLRELAADDGSAWPRFDLVLLGLGSDGHTASLFPGSATPLPAAQPTLAVLADYDDRPAGRVSLTPPVLNSARHLIFLVRGAEKAEALARVLEGPEDPVAWPAQRIQPEEGTLIWFADDEAARLLRRRA